MFYFITPIRSDSVAHVNCLITDPIAMAADFASDIPVSFCLPAVQVKAR
jgi:hypothetical protein